MASQLFEPFTANLNSTGLAKRTLRYSGGSAIMHDPTIKAILAYCYGSMYGVPVAMGKKDDLYFTEVQVDPMQRVAVIYYAATKEIRAGIKKAGSSILSPYTIKRGEMDGSEIILAMIKSFLENQDFSQHFNVVHNFCTTVEKEKFASTPDVDEALAAICDLTRKAIENDGLCVNVTQARVPVLPSDMSRYNPSLVIDGFSNDFSIFTRCPETTSSESAKSEENETFILDPNRKWSEQEQALIPAIPDWYIMPEYVVSACKMVSAKKLGRPVRNIMFRGEAGTGKTEAAKAMAAELHIPYVSLCCHPDMSITDFTGTILPKLDNTSPSSSVSSSTFDMARMPSFLDIQMDPVYAYSMLTGEEKDDATEEEVLSLMLQRAAESPAPASSNGLSYEYSDSPLVKAIRNGWLCEIQEPAIIERAGVLTGLNSLLDTCQQVVLPTGEIVKRHPDCVLVVTTNTNYQGCKEINNSVISRMQFKKDTELPSNEELMERVSRITGFTDNKVLSEMIKVVQEMHTTCLENMITDGSCGVRELIDWVQAYSVLGDIIKSAECTIIPSATADPESQADLRTSCLFTHFSGNKQ